MEYWTRKTLNLPPNATDADAAAALAKGGHGVTMRQLEQKDSKLLLTLRASSFPVYNRLYSAQYGTDATPVTDKDDAQKTQLSAAQEEEITLAGWRSGRAKIPVTYLKLSRDRPDVLLRLQQEEPVIYARLYKEFYGREPEQPAAPSATSLAAGSQAGQGNLLDRLLQFAQQQATTPAPVAPAPPVRLGYTGKLPTGQINLSGRDPFAE